MVSICYNVEPISSHGGIYKDCHSESGEGTTRADGPPQATVAKVATLSKYTREALPGGLTPDAAFEKNGRRIASSHSWRPPTLKSLFSRYTAIWSRWSSRLRRGGGNPDPTRREQLTEGEICAPDDAGGGLREDKAKGPTPKRRALLVGISYKHSPSNEWKHLDGTHIDVERFRELLIGAYIVHSSQPSCRCHFPGPNSCPRNLRILPRRHYRHEGQPRAPRLLSTQS